MQNHVKSAGRWRYVHSGLCNPRHSSYNFCLKQKFYAQNTVSTCAATFK